jgi:glycosyltransferase involved in cell wall biosynthesis
MRILWYNWRDIKNPDAGGAEVFTHEVCKRLLGGKDGAQSITLFAASFDGSKPEEIVDGIRIVRAGSKYSVYKKAKEFYLQNKDNFDIVIDEVNTKPFGTPSFVHDKPIVALIHQLAREFWFYETKFPINILGYYFLEKYWLSKYRNVTTMTVSNSTMQDLKHLGFTDVHVVPEGLSFSPLHALPEIEIKPTVLFVGRLKKAKRPDDALKAFRKIKDEIRDAKFWMVGSGYMEGELRAMVHKMFPDESAAADITIFGRQTSEKKLELMSRAHVLLVPGVREGWGLVVTEANAMGTPAVAYDVPGLRDSVIDGVTGKLVHKDDYLGMAIEAVGLLKDHIKRKTYSKNALENAKAFDWQTTAMRIQSILSQCRLEYSKASTEQVSTTTVSK